jgi:hypothetical protein
MKKQKGKNKDKKNKGDDFDYLTKKLELRTEVQMKNINSLYQNKLWGAEIISLHLSIIKEHIKINCQTFNQTLDTKDYR